MRSSIAASVVLVLSLASAISAHTHHGKRAQKPGRNWGRRQLDSILTDVNITLSNSVGNTSFNASVTVDTLLPTDIPTATVYLTAVPDIVTGDITISNTEAAAPQQTGDAVGADRGDTFPLPLCQVLAPFGSYCDPTSTDCCATGTTCISNLCQRLCDISTVEAYCDDEFPCDATLGYVCTSSRCRPPATATHVAVGATCDQGTANTLFCLPGKATCYSSTCVICTQHS